MPWRIQGRYLVNTETGKRKNKKPMSKAALRRYQRALYANVPEARRKAAKPSSGGGAEARVPAGQSGGGRWTHKESRLRRSIRNKLTRPKAIAAFTHPAEISGVMVKAHTQTAMLGMGKNPEPSGVLRLRSMRGRYMGLVGQRLKPKVLRPKFKEWLRFKAGYRSDQKRDSHGRWTYGDPGSGTVARHTHFARPTDAYLANQSAGKPVITGTGQWDPGAHGTRRGAQEGARAIDSVLHFPKSFIKSAGKRSLVTLLRDHYYALGSHDNDTRKIELATDAAHKPSSPATFVHEFGHHISEYGPIRHAKMGSVVDMAMDSYHKAIWPSPEAKSLMRMFKTQKIERNGVLTGLTHNEWRYVAYLLDPREMFARAFTQYIALRSHAPSLMREITKVHSVRFPVYWTPEHFQGIGEGLDHLFRTTGWLLPPGSKEFNPSQPRDAQGRWTAGGSGGGAKKNHTLRNRFLAAAAGGAAGVAIVRAVQAYRHHQAREYIKQDHYTGTPEQKRASAALAAMRAKVAEDLRQSNERINKLKTDFRKGTSGRGSRKTARRGEAARWAKQAEEGLWGIATGGKYGGVFGGYLPPPHPQLPPPSSKEFNPNQARDALGRWTAGAGGYLRSKLFPKKVTVGGVTKGVLKRAAIIVGLGLSATIVQALALMRTNEAWMKPKQYHDWLRQFSDPQYQRHTMTHAEMESFLRTWTGKAYNPSQPRDYHGRWGIGGVQLTGKNRFRAQKTLHSLPGKALDATGRAVGGAVGAAIKPLPVPAKILASLVAGEGRAIINRSGLRGAVMRNLSTTRAGKRARLKYTPPKPRVVQPKTDPWGPWGPRAKLYTGKERFKAGFNSGQLRDWHGRWSSGGLPFAHIGSTRHIRGVIHELYNLGGPRPLPGTSYVITGNLRVGKRLVEGAYDNQRVLIRHNTDTPGLTTAHETGHMLDHRGLGTSWASENSPALAAWRKAVDDSAKVRQINRWREAGYIATDGNHFFVHSDQVWNYLLNRKEQWARAFAQWHAYRSHNGRTMRELRIAQRGVLPYYWSDKDFKPIYNAVEAVMRQQGYIK